MQREGLGGGVTDYDSISEKHRNYLDNMYREVIAEHGPLIPGDPEIEKCPACSGRGRTYEMVPIGTAHTIERKECLKCNGEGWVTK